jgi:hypothetical protein
MKGRGGLRRARALVTERPVCSTLPVSLRLSVLVPDDSRKNREVMPPEREPTTIWSHNKKAVGAVFFFQRRRAFEAPASLLSHVSSLLRATNAARVPDFPRTSTSSSAFLSPFVVFRGAYVYARAFARRMNNQNYITFADTIITSTRTPRAPPACPRARRTPRTARVLTP